MSSLRIRLALWLLLPLSLFVALCAFLGWYNAAAVADYVQDHDLLASAKVLSDRLIWDEGDVQASVPPSALSLFVSPERDQVFLSVTGARGELLAGSPEFPLPAVREPQGVDRAQWYDATYRGQKLRAVLITRSMYDVDGAREYAIAVGKTTGSRNRMLLELWRPTVIYLLAALALTVLLGVLALTLELRPVMRLRQQLAGRDPLHLDLVVDEGALHTELRPVAATLNRFVRQLQAHSDAQRRFIADAAHQLRTPLAMQATQIEYALYTRSRGDWATRRADMDALWAEMQASNRRLVQVTNQLLLLAQAEHGDAHTGLQAVDLKATALHCVTQLAALAERRRMDLGLEVADALADASVLVWAQPALLDALVSNLLDNALRYTQEGGRVTVSVQREPDAVLLTVADNGPGIAPEAREHVFERFYRAAPGTEGTGLGLAIVREIARAFGAEVTLDENPNEPHGLRVTVRFPVAP
jgi:two-component system sensor histidine kinase TctE